jgi:polar amino acid transport system substrate-binding protein
MVSDLLRQRGYQVVDSIKSAEDGLRLLAAGGADVAVLQGHVSQRLVRYDPRFKGKLIEGKWPYLVLDAYLLFNRQLYQHQSARIDAIWAAVAGVRGSAEYQKLESQQQGLLESMP